MKRKRTSKKRFSHYYQFGFTGTPIFAENALQEGETTAAVFGALLHSYKITDAIRDDKVLKFKVDYNEVRPVPVLFPPLRCDDGSSHGSCSRRHQRECGRGFKKRLEIFPKTLEIFPKTLEFFLRTMEKIPQTMDFLLPKRHLGRAAYRMAERVDDFEKLSNADVQAALMHPRRIAEISAYILKKFQKQDPPHGVGCAGIQCHAGSEQCEGCPSLLSRAENDR